MKTFLIIFLLFIGLIVGGFMVRLIFFPVHTAEKMMNTAYDAVSKTINADNAIYNYEWFKQTHQDIVAQKAQLQNAIKAADSFKQEAGERKDWSFDDKQESARLNSVQLGIENNLEQTIANYNARASMANRNIFENNILPSFIDALTFIKQ